MANRTFADYAASLSSGTLDSVIGLDDSTVKTGSAGGASYLVYTALLTQTGTDAPVATVLENTLGGTVVWTRNDTGDYTGTLAGVFTENKTWCSVTNKWSNGDYVTHLGQNNVNSVSLYNEGTDLSPADEFNDMSIEIRVYP